VDQELGGASRTLGPSLSSCSETRVELLIERNSRNIIMADDVAEFFENWPGKRQQIKEQASDVARGFGGFYQATMKDGALSVREKELIALGIALAQRCTPCINLHVQGCIKAGAAREQVLEAAGVAVVMQGGPAFTHFPEVIAALDHLRRTDIS
jgi:AhpD family alkylhydroperoxidase